ncbi:MAG: 5'-3' exonuclease [Gammaproteobacteria bacterium]
MTKGRQIDSATNNRVYLVDASIYVFRAWFTLPESFTDRDGVPVNAVYGFTDFVHRLLTDTGAGKIAFAFDQSLTSSFRNDIYPSYKANRESAPDNLMWQFKRCREFVRLIGLTELCSDRYEADDLIGAAATHARREGSNVTVVTGDKDLMQLVDEGDLWWDFAKNKRLDSAGVEKQSGVRPEQIADQLAIAGDKIDNIPGVPGVGMVTAAKLLRHFGTIDELLANLAQISAMKFRGARRVQHLLEQHRETILLAKKLTVLHCDAPLPADLELRQKWVDNEQLIAFFDQLGFGQPRRDRWCKLLAQRSPISS